MRFPRLYAAASLKHRLGGGPGGRAVRGFPRLYAAASLKQAADRLVVQAVRVFSAALCRGLIEAPCARPAGRRTARRFPRLYAAASLKQSAHVAQPPLLVGGFPRLYAAASLKPGARARRRSGPPGGFPRLYAAASLKRHDLRALVVRGALFSAALCRGLIEAGGSGCPTRGRWRVFRGFMPRPH